MDNLEKPRFAQHLGLLIKSHQGSFPQREAPVWVYARLAVLHRIPKEPSPALFAGLFLCTVEFDIWGK